MTVAHVATVAFVGIEARDVDVQVHIADAGTKEVVTIVGLPDKAVAESRERVRAALHAAGLAIPPKRITINLSPADLPKEGSHYDLPIALGLLTAMGVLPAHETAAHVAVGELSLDGALVTVAGVLPAAIRALELEYAFICPEGAGPEAAWAEGLRIVAAPSLVALINHLKGAHVLPSPKVHPVEDGLSLPDLRDVKGQETAKRALEIAAAGGHNLLMIGPPGAGKSMLAARLPGLLPPLDAREALEVSMIQSLAGELKNGEVGRRRPFRSPHHSASMAALVGGGMRAKPGEVSLAHLGVLFLDELPEFQRQVLDALRQPLETGETLVARANAHIRYPSRVQLVAAMNPCRRVAIRPKLDTRRISQKPKGYSEHPTTLAGHLLRRRKELGLFQREVAQRLGIRHDSYLAWEKHDQEPEVWRWRRIVNFLGYDPHPAPASLSERIAAYRRRNGLTHRELGKRVGVHECTVQSWERGRHPPRGRNLRILRGVIEDNDQ